jgi:N-acetylglucosamine-6-phosphate deacetylase
MILAGASIVLPDRMMREGFLRITAGKIAEVSTQPLPPRADETIVDLSGLCLLPGFIDLHIHGALGRDAMEATPEAFDTICNFHAAGGTTSLCLTTIPAPHEQLLHTIGAIKKYRSASLENTNAASQKKGAQVLGIHLEGPWFSPEKPGAHNPALLRNPDPAEWRALIADADLIKQVTLAPELPGALPLIEALAKVGIIASAGHTNATDAQAAAAFAHGLRHATHTFNCMGGARREGPFRVAGVLEYVLSEPDILCEAIADGRHISPTLLHLLCRAKGIDGIALITDATAGAGLPDGSHFTLGETPCVVRDGVALTADSAEGATQTALAGSTTTMVRNFGNMINLCGLSLMEASHMASSNPARALRIDHRKGAIAPGLDADLVALTPDLVVRQTWIAGTALV